MKRLARMGIAPGMIKAQAELCVELALRPRSPLQESAAHAALARLRPVVFSMRGRHSLRHGSARSRRHGISLRITAGNFPRDLAIAPQSSDSKPTSPSPPIPMRPARRPRILAGVSCNSNRQRSRTTGFFAHRSFVCRSTRQIQRKKKPTACSKPLTAGASATCAAWPRCRKLRSASASDSKACNCSSWRAAPLRALWSQ